MLIFLISEVPASPWWFVGAVLGALIIAAVAEFFRNRGNDINGGSNE